MKPTNTPWGIAQTVDELVPGIWHVTTASHGGIYVSPELWQRMPDYMQSTPYSQDGWFEEDCDWCLPFIVFQDELRHSVDEFARHTVLTGTHLAAFQYDYHDSRRRHQAYSPRENVLEARRIACRHLRQRSTPT